MVGSFGHPTSNNGQQCPTMLAFVGINVGIVFRFKPLNNQELGNRFHKFADKARIDTFMNLFPSLFVFLVLSSNQN